jgi:aryl carrier-like protein
LAALLAEILGAGPLDVQTQFFELGANSLTLVQFRNRIRQEWGRTVPMADLFAQGTIRRLAHLIDGRPDAAVTSLREATAGARRRILEAAGTG